MKLARLLTHLAATAFATAVFGVASAAPLTGTVSSVGTLCLGVDGTNSVGDPCAAQNVASLRYFDFITSGLLTATPGTPGNLRFLTATGDLMPLVDQVGQINDFMIPMSDLSTFTPVADLWTGTGNPGGDIFTFSLDALTLIDRATPNSLAVNGYGTMCRNGIDCNLFSFIFTTQNAQGAITTTFSLSQSGIAIPEPGSLALLGLGLAALLVRARRQVK